MYEIEQQHKLRGDQKLPEKKPKNHKTSSEPYPKTYSCNFIVNDVINGDLPYYYKRICNETFYRADLLKRHQKIHEKNHFVCDYQGCNYTCSRRDNLDNHMR